VKTEQLHGTVVFVEGNKLVVKMANGDLRTFEPPADRKFIVDGQELTVDQLKTGTKLTATVTTTTTPITERTTTVGTGKVWYVAGNTVILTLPNNENRQYKVAESYRFMVDGKKATVHELRKGMIVSAEKIVEEPRTEIASNTTVTGHAPAPPPVVAESTRPAEPVPTPAPAPARTPAPAEHAAAPAAPAAAAEELPKTGSPFPMIGLLGLLFTGGALGLRKLRSL
jgi:LPXTG-motif cell wall-anchored protein